MDGVDAKVFLAIITRHENRPTAKITRRPTREYTEGLPYGFRARRTRPSSRKQNLSLGERTSSKSSTQKKWTRRELNPETWVYKTLSPNLAHPSGRSGNRTPSAMPSPPAVLKTAAPAKTRTSFRKQKEPSEDHFFAGLSFSPGERFRRFRPLSIRRSYCGLDRIPFR